MGKETFDKKFPTLAKGLASGDPEERVLSLTVALQLARTKVGKAWTGEVIKRVARMLEDEVPEVRLAAARTLSSGFPRFRELDHIVIAGIGRRVSIAEANRDVYMSMLKKKETLAWAEEAHRMRKCLNEYTSKKAQPLPTKVIALAPPSERREKRRPALAR